MFSYLLPTSPFSEEECSQPCSVTAPEPVSLMCQGHVVSCGSEHLAAGWLYMCPVSALHSEFCTQLSAAHWSPGLDFQLIR